jgi:hypothetical protein
MKPTIVKIRPAVHSNLLNGRGYTIHQSPSSAWIPLNAIQQGRLGANGTVLSSDHSTTFFSTLRHQNPPPTQDKAPPAQPGGTHEA